MDEFAQSREDDDLFADDFEPVTQPVSILQNQPENRTAQSIKSKPSFQPTQDSRNSNPQTRHRGQDRAGQARGKQVGRGGGGGLSGSRFASKTETLPEAAIAKEVSDPTSKIPTPPPATSDNVVAVQSNSAAGPPKLIPASDTYTTAPAAAEIQPSMLDSTTTITTENPPSSILTALSTPARTPAVRGDRSLTGGPSHKKLTEEELTAKLSKMAILNAQKSEKHRLTEADQAAFQSRETELQAKLKKKTQEEREKDREEREKLKEKVKLERQNERQMEMERAKNRERKMKAQGGREWDSEKQDSDLVDRKGRSSEYVRGGHGGVINVNGRGGGLGSSRFATDDNSSQNAGSGSPGRGGLNIRGRAGRGRGGRAIPPTSDAEEDFPALPKANSAKELFPSKVDKKMEPRKEEVLSPMSEKPAGDWAEEMATPVEGFSFNSSFHISNKPYTHTNHLPSVTSTW
jgi:hypothetical protein